MQTDATINTGSKVNPVPIGALGVFAGAFVNAGHRTGIHAVSNPFTDVCNNGVGHRSSSITNYSLGGA